MKGQVAVRLYFRPNIFEKKITWLESALNSEQNYVFVFQKMFALVPLGSKRKKTLFFSIQFDLYIGYRPC